MCLRGENEREATHASVDGFKIDGFKIEGKNLFRFSCFLSKTSSSLVNTILGHSSLFPFVSSNNCNMPFDVLKKHISD